MTTRLTEWTTCGGCAAKWGRRRCCHPIPWRRPGLPTELRAARRAGAVRRCRRTAHDDERASCRPPTSSPGGRRPSDFGAIAGRQRLQRRLSPCAARFCWRSTSRRSPEQLPPESRRDLRGGSVATSPTPRGRRRGHTIRSEELIFGLACGPLPPRSHLDQGRSGSRDALVLSKTIGTGIVPAGGSDGAKAATTAGMRALNRAPPAP